MPRLRSLKIDEIKPISASILLPTFWSRLVELRYLDRCCK